MARIRAGQRFGKWTAIKTESIVSDSGRVRTKWLVQCDCGTKQLCGSNDLNKGKTTKCRECYGKAPQNLKGKQFGSWTVKEEGKKNQGKTHWICKCSCGSIVNVCAASLTKGVSTRCINCHQSSMPHHGYTSKLNRHPLYDIWMGMLARCRNPTSGGYAAYGGRGITVCDRWNDLELFYLDMGERPDGHSIDRINNDDGYYPENCRWATVDVQASNRRNNRWLTHDGETKTLSQWSRKLGVNVDTLAKFLERHSFEYAHQHYTKKGP